MGRPFSPKKRIMIRPIVMRKLGRDETRIVYKPSLPLRGGNFSKLILEVCRHISGCQPMVAFAMRF
jgi:hypothetical protein